MQLTHNENVDRPIMRHVSFALVLLTVVASACGSKGSPTSPSTPPNAPAPGSTGTSTMSATIDGVPWTASVSVQTIFNNGNLQMTGADTRMAVGLAVTANRGPGTFTTTTDFLTGTLGDVTGTTLPVKIWMADTSGFGSGTLTLTTLTSTSASGTFTMALVPSPGSGATGNRSMTNGKFSVTFSAPTLPPGLGVNGTLNALIDGVLWRASVSAQGGYTSEGVLSFAGQDIDTRTIGFALRASGPGVYSLNFAAGVGNAFMNVGGQSWSTASPGGVGSVTITTLTTARAAGTFSMTMQPSLMNTVPKAAQVTNGQFDLALTPQ